MTTTSSGKTNRLRSGAIISQMVDDFYEDLRQAPGQGRPVAFCDGFPLPFPILVTMDIAYFFGDVYSATTAARHLEKPLQQVAEDRGYVSEICSYTRNTMGCVLFPEDRLADAPAHYRMPRPDLILCTDPGCSMLVNWADDERRRFDKPMFILQVPHVYYGDEERDAVIDLTKQLREMIVFVEDITRRKLDWNKLKTVMANVKEAITFRKLATQMSRHVPAPATFFDSATALGGVNYAVGKPECTSLYRNMLEEVTERVSRKEGAVFGEKYRFYWDGLPVWPKLGVLAQKFANMGAAAVCGRYTNMGFYSKPEAIDPEHPLESLAENAVILHLNHNIPWLVDNVSDLCREFAVDGLVMHAHRTCRSIAAVQLELMDGVSRRLGIPGVFFEADMADEQFYSDEQVNTRLQALIESVDAKRRAVS